MTDRIKVGNVVGSTGVAIGKQARANVQMKSGVDAGELAALLAQLRTDITEAPIPEPAKKVMLEKAVPAIEEAAASQQPEKAANGIERINDQLEGLATGVDHVSKIAETVKKIAGITGVAVSAAAPYLARLMGW